MEAITLSLQKFLEDISSFLSHQNHIFTDFIGDIQPVSLSLYNYALSLWQISKEDLWESLKLHFHWRECEKQSTEWNPGLCFTTLSHLLISPKLWRDLMDVYQQAMKTKILTDSSSKLLALKRHQSGFHFWWSMSYQCYVSSHQGDMALIDRLNEKTCSMSLSTYESLHTKGQESVGLDSLLTCALVSSYIAKKCIIFECWNKIISVDNGSVIKFQQFKNKQANCHPAICSSKGRPILRLFLTCLLSSFSPDFSPIWFTEGLSLPPTTSKVAQISYPRHWMRCCF